MQTSKCLISRSTTEPGESPYCLWAQCAMIPVCFVEAPVSGCSWSQPSAEESADWPAVQGTTPMKDSSFLFPFPPPHTRDAGPQHAWSISTAKGSSISLPASNGFWSKSTTGSVPLYFSWQSQSLPPLLQRAHSVPVKAEAQHRVWPYRHDWGPGHMVSDLPTSLA